MIRLITAAALMMAAGACSKNNDPAEHAADHLEAAADQSDPEATEVLTNEADAIRDRDFATGNAGDPNGSVQSAMENAGEAQAAH